MPRVKPLERGDANAATRDELNRIAAAHGRVTNMKQTLAHEPVALEALMEWYPLREIVVEFLGERATLLFVHAISRQTDCLICSTFFRRILIDSGEDPDALDLNDWEGTIVELGRQLVRDANNVGDELYARLAARLAPRQIVALIAFGGLMIATNVFNNALRVELDEYLVPYRAAADAETATGVAREP